MTVCVLFIICSLFVGGYFLPAATVCLVFRDEQQIRLTQNDIQTSWHTYRDNTQDSTKLLKYRLGMLMINRLISVKNLID